MSNLFFRSFGEGEPIIILHGLFGSSDNWVSVGKLLSGTHRIYLLDLRNHGQSLHVDSFTYMDMAKDVKQFIDNQEIFKPIMIGHSMGGKVAMKLATEHPNLLKKLIVVDIAPKYYPIHHETILAGLNSIRLNTLESRKDADRALARYLTDNGIRQFLLKNLTRNSENEFYWKINLEAISKNIENVGEELPENKQYTGPTLFIDGAKSDYILPADKESILKIFPNALIEEIEGAGHWVHAERPNEFVEVVNDFVAES